MPDSVPLMGPCRLLHILGQKNPPQRDENPIRVFHASRLLHACKQVSYRPLLSPVSSLPLDPLLPKVILPQDNCRALYLYIALASEVPVSRCQNTVDSLPCSMIPLQRHNGAYYIIYMGVHSSEIPPQNRGDPTRGGRQIHVSVRRLIRTGRCPGWRVGNE